MPNVEEGITEIKKELNFKDLFDSPEKRNDVIFNIKRVKMPKYGLKTKFKIIRLLKNNNMSAKEISRKLYIGHDSILSHLNNLYKENKVNIISKGKHNENIWELTNKFL